MYQKELFDIFRHIRACVGKKYWDVENLEDNGRLFHIQKEL